MLDPPKPPSPDELEALIREARERQRRRRLLAAAAITGAMAIGLAIYALVSAGTPRLTSGLRRRTGAAVHARTIHCEGTNTA